jgi:apolipoprotein N-acyltransferase
MIILWIHVHFECLWNKYLVVNPCLMYLHFIVACLFCLSVNWRPCSKN